jgi:hypothetical protein
MRWMAALLGTLRALVIAGAASSGAAHAQQPQSADDAAWEAARSAGTPSAYQRYLEEFPAGQHAEEAFRLLIEETAPEAGESSRFSVDIY